jgi:hypothetical protein
MDILHEIPLDEIAELDVMSLRCNELHAVAPSYATVELEVKDLKTGEIVSRYGDLSRSWTRNYYNLITSQMFCSASGVLGTTYADAYTPVKGTGGTVRYATNFVASTGVAYSSGMRSNETAVGTGWRGAGAATGQGIVLGRGTGAEALNDYVLGTPILEGTSLNAMNYAVMAAPAVTWDAGTRKFKCIGSRIIVNNSALSIGVNETAIYCSGSATDNAETFCLTRDKLGAQVDVAAVSQVTVTYTLYSPALP